MLMDGINEIYSMSFVDPRTGAPGRDWPGFNCDWKTAQRPSYGY